MSLTGEKDGPPYKLGTSISDITAGMAATQGILAALLAREQTGFGQHVDIGMLDVSAALLTYQAGIYFATEKVPQRRGNEHPSIVPYSTYDCEDGTIIIAVGNDTMFKQFCLVLQKQELAQDERFMTAALRVQNRNLLDQLIKDLFKEKKRDGLLSLLRDKGIPCGAVKDLKEVCQSPQLRARGMIQSVSHPVAGEISQLGFPLHLSDTPCTMRLPPPMLGQHTEEILTEVIGMGAEQVAHLKKDGVI